MKHANPQTPPRLPSALHVPLAAYAAALLLAAFTRSWLELTALVLVGVFVALVAAVIQ
jgi:hypothetical protein